MTDEIDTFVPAQEDEVEPTKTDLPGQNEPDDPAGTPAPEEEEKE